MADPDIYALDIETAPNEDTKAPLALEPYRLKQGRARVTCVTIVGPNNYVFMVHERANNIDSLKAELAKLKGKKVVGQNTKFDVAWLIDLCGEDVCRDIQWLDTRLLGKWITNGKESFADYSLIGLVDNWLQDHPLYEEFAEIKHRKVSAGEDYEYWLRRNVLDSTLTRDLFIHLARYLPASCRSSYLREQRNTFPVALGWLRGLKLDVDGAKALQPKIATAKRKISEALGVDQTVLTSPTQLGRLIFDSWGLQGLTKTKRGWSTNKDDLAKLNIMHKGTDVGKRLQLIMEFKQVATLQTKYVDGIERVALYNGCDYNYSTPNLFSTYTGRFTYASSYSKMKGATKAMQPGIATHQIPRKGPVRGLLSAGEGYYTAELDAAAQEMRGMAVAANEQVMIRGFNSGMDMHGAMAARIGHMSYEEFMPKYKGGDKACDNFRYAGKLLNLSCQYRIGYKSLMDKFFSNYQIILAAAESRNYLKLYKQQYPDIPRYWEDAIDRAKSLGYAESIGGRRYYIDDWSGRNKWSAESSAINFPIQGMGADHKNVAIAEISDNYREVQLMVDLHDGLWYRIPHSGGVELVKDMQHHLNTLDYEDIWQKEIPIPLPFDAKIGNNFGDVRDI